jgi:hypothetical protein
METIFKQLECLSSYTICPKCTFTSKKIVHRPTGCPVCRKQFRVSRAALPDTGSEAMYEFGIDWSYDAFGVRCCWVEGEGIRRRSIAV